MAMTNTPGAVIKYIGDASSYTDPVAGTGTWVSGETRTVDDDIGQLLASNTYNFQKISDLGVPYAEIDPITWGIEIAKVAKGRTTAELASSPTVADIALGDSTLFYDIADPTKRYAMNAGHNAFVAVGGSSPSGATVSAMQYVLKNPSGASDIGTVTGSGAVTAFETIDGVPVVSVTAAAGVSTTLNFKAFTGRLLPDGCVTVGLYVWDMDTLSSVTLYLGDGSGFTNAFSVSLTDSSAFPCNGWYEIIVDPYNGATEWSTLTEASQRRWAVSAGSPSFDSTLFTNIKAVISTDAGKAAKVSFAEVAIGKSAAKGQICFVMDDGGDTQWSRAIPILERYGMRASMGIIATSVGQANYMTLAQLQGLVARGHECIVHGATTLTTLADMAAVETEIKVHRDYLVNNGLAVNGSEKIYLYPQNVLRGGILGVAGEILRQKLIDLGFIGARTTSVTGFLSSKFTGLGSRWMIPEIGHRSATDTEANETANVDRVILRMQQAVALGRSVVITNHNIKPDTPGVAPTSSIDIQVSNYKRIIKAAYDLVSSGRAENVLLSTAIKRSMTATV